MNEISALLRNGALLEVANDTDLPRASNPPPLTATSVNRVALQSFEARATPCQSCTSFWSSRPVQILSVAFLIGAIIVCAVSPGGLASILLLAALAVALFVVIAAIQKDRIENAPLEDNVEDLPYAEETNPSLTSTESLLNAIKINRNPALIRDFYYLTVQKKIKEELKTHIQEDLDNIFGADNTISAEIAIDSTLDRPKAPLFQLRFNLQSIRKIILEFHQKNEREHCEEHILNYLFTELERVIIPVIKGFIALDQEPKFSDFEDLKDIVDTLIQNALNNLFQRDQDWTPAECLLSADISPQSAPIIRNALYAGIQNAEESLRKFLEDYESPLSGNRIFYSGPITAEDQDDLEEVFTFSEIADIDE